MLADITDRNTLIMKIKLFALLSTFTIFLSFTTFSQTTLVKGDTLVRSINYGDMQLYKVKIAKGNFYKLVIIQNGIDIQIKLKSSGIKDSVFDSPNGISGPEPVEFLATANGYALLEVMPLNDSSNTKRGEYTIKYLQQISAGEYTKMLKQREAEKNEFVDWIKQNAVPLKTVKANSGFEDLDFLKPLLINKRVIGIGEATHGTKEFFKMKHRMLEFLVTQMGFTVFGIEASYGRCKYINDYVLTGKGNLDTATVIQGFTTWSTEEVRDMIQWMRSYNETHPDKKVQFVGFDLQVNDEAEFAISNYYKKVDAAKKQEVDSLLKQVAAAEKHGGIFSGDTTIRTLINPVQNLICNFIEKEGNYILKSNKQEYDEILWSEKILHQFLVSYSYNNFIETVKKEDRDFYMAQNILTWLSYFPKGTKIMIWAHNGHIAKDFLDAVAVPSMGSYLKEALKDEYYAIGFDFYKGSFLSNDIDLPNSVGWEKEAVGEAPEGNLSSYFVKAGLGNSFLDFSLTNQNDNIKQWLNDKIIGTYSMGSQFSKTWSSQQYIAPMKIHHAFDGVFFVKESNSAVPVKWLAINNYKF